MISISDFQRTIWDFYKQNKRTFLWREQINPYYVVVSEIMLQQTQTHRVIDKFKNWIDLFPDFLSLSQAPLHQVITAWQGLGYNRRALALQKIAQKVIAEYECQLPQSPEILQTFPGIGKATAGSICAFAFGMPTTFIETNIRAVFIHFFFKDQGAVTDAQLEPLVAASVDANDPRQWYYALMDYGVMLKKEFKNPSRKSAHHAKQTKFEGSFRQIRGAILKLLAHNVVVDGADFYDQIPRQRRDIDKALDQLMREGFIKEANGRFFIGRD